MYALDQMISAPTENERTVMGMAEYIERERLKQAFRTDTEHLQVFDSSMYEILMYDIDELPAADVVHVVHAEYRLDGFCTNCGYRADVQSIGFNCTGGTRIEYKRTKFCPECGAKMDGDMENNRQAEVIR